MPVVSELQTQSSDATTGHAKGQPLSTGQRASIATFELELASAQIFTIRRATCGRRAPRAGRMRQRIGSRDPASITRGPLSRAISAWSGQPLSDL
jgi:hypothetical protein